MKKILLKSTYIIYSLCLLSLLYLIAVYLFEFNHPIAIKFTLVSIIIMLFSISYTIFLTIIALIPFKYKDILKLLRRFIYLIVSFSTINIALDFIIKRKINVIHGMSTSIGVAFGITFITYIFKYFNENT